MISETISTIIIFSTVIVISLLIFSISLYMLQSSTQAAEYGYVKTVFVNLANSIPNLLEGGSYAANIPTRTVGLGYLNKTDITVSIIINNITQKIDHPIMIYAKTVSATSTINRTIFGININESVVNESLNIARVREVYYLGATYIILDTMKPYLRIYEYKYNNITTYTITITYVKLKPVVISTKPSRLVVVLGDVETKTYKINISSLPSDQVLSISITGYKPYILSKDDLVGLNTDYIYVNLKIITLRVVYM
jgi:hypothetical protein